MNIKVKLYSVLILLFFIFNSSVYAVTGIEKYESQPEGKLDDVQVTGAMITDQITKRLNIRTGKGNPVFNKAESFPLQAVANEILEEKGKLALLLADGDTILYEGHRAPSSPESVNMGLSMGKTLTGLAIGKALCEQKISSLQEKGKAYSPRLSGLSYGEATIENLLTMKGGGKPGNPSGQVRPGMFRNLLFQKEVLKDQIVEVGNGNVAPGTQFSYENMSTHALVYILEAAYKKGYLEILADEIFKDIEFERPLFHFVDKNGEAIAAGGLHATTRDWARVGMRIKEYWEGKHGQCMADFLNNGSTPKDRSGYGFQVWIHKSDSNQKIIRLAGALGQRMYLNNTNRKILITFSNGASDRSVDKLVDTWMSK